MDAAPSGLVSRDLLLAPQPKRLGDGVLGQVPRFSGCLQALTGGQIEWVDNFCHPTIF
jgi:hypothetical protein